MVGSGGSAAWWPVLLLPLLLPAPAAAQQRIQIGPPTVAFLPLFVDAARPAGPQLALLGGVFLGLALVLDSLWALLAGSAKGVLDRYALHRAAQKACGAMMLAAAAWLALRRAN